MKLEGARVLVTGGSGFVPSHVADELVRAGARVTVVDDLSTGRRDNLAGADVELVELDICDPTIEDVVARHDAVVHMAANADVPRSVREPDYDFHNNVVGSFNVLRAARRHELARVLFASSAAVYGDPVYTPIDEAHPTSPRSPYGAAKLATEKLGFAYLETYGLPFTAIRIFNTYGVRQPRYVMYDLLRKLYADPRHLEVLGTGEQVRDYSYVTDTARCFALALSSDEAVGQVYNVAGGNPISIAALADRLIATLGLSDVEITYTGQSWPGDIAVLIADITKAQSELGFAPSVPLERGITLLEEWLRADSGVEQLPTLG